MCLLRAGPNSMGSALSIAAGIVSAFTAPRSGTLCTAPKAASSARMTERPRESANY